MAVILRSGASRSITTQSVTSLRSSTIDIAKTGLINSMTSDGKAVKALNLGYQGEHNVTRLYVQLRESTGAAISAGTLTSGYEPILVFCQGVRKVTLTMSNDEGRFYLDLPNTLTSVSGNYQIYFALKERISKTDPKGGAIGTEDDPAYREIFVSDVCKGVVDANSGYSLIPAGFDWATSIYDYNIGAITLDSKSWEEEEVGMYSTSVWLPGLQTDKTVNDIEVILPDGISISDKALNSETKTLSFQANFLVDVDGSLLDQIIIKYPVNFSVNSSFSSFAQKTPIEVQFDPAGVSINKDKNQNLGMKMDAYVTPIDMSLLYNFPLNTKKYTIFSKGNKTYVCEMKSNYCWIPIQVTGEAGIWQVSFAVRGTSSDAEVNYEYYTGILKLPVVDNVLTKTDLASQTAYRAVLDSDAKALYDKNDYALYAMSESSDNATLDYTANAINLAIGWVDGVRPYVSAVEMVQAVTDFQGVKADYANINTNVNSLATSINSHYKLIQELQTQDTKLASADTALDQRIDGLEELISGLDVSILEGRVSANEENISTINESLATVTTRVGDLETTSENHEDRIETAEDNITSLTAQVSSLSSNVNENTHAINDISNDIIQLTSDVARHEMDFTSVRQFGELLANEIEIRSKETTALSDRIFQEEQRAQKAESDLSQTLQAEVERAIGVENEIKTNLDTETQARIDADDAITNSLIEENARAVQAEESLNKKIEDEISRAELAEQDIRDLLKVEEDRAIAKETELYEAITTEVERATNREDELNQAILDEEQRATGSEEKLSGRLDSVETVASSALTGVNSINQDKAYVRNDFNEVAEKIAYVFKIVYLNSEADYKQLEKKEQGTLYLIREEA